MPNKITFLFPILLPSYLIKLNLPTGGSINLLDILILVFIFTCVFNIFRKQKGGGVEFAIKNKNTLALLGLFLLGLVLSCLANTTDWTGSLGIVKSFYLLPIVFAIFFGFYALQNKDFLKYFFAGYFFYSSLLAVIGVIYLLSHRLTYDNRLVIFFESPNQLAIALAPGILIGSFFLFFHKPIFSKNPKLSYAIILLSALQLFVLLQTQSLGAIIGLAFAGAFLIFKNSQKQISSLTIILSLVSFFLIFNASFFLKLTSYNPNIPANAIDSRLAIYQTDEKMLKSNFFFGIGPGNFQQTYLDYQKHFPPYPQWAVPHAHSLLANIWLETGIIGLLSFLAIIYLVYKKIPAKGSHVSTYVMICVSILVYFLIHGLFDTTYWKNDLAILFWLSLLLPLFNPQSPARNSQLKKESLESFLKS